MHKEYVDALGLEAIFWQVERRYAGQNVPPLAGLSVASPDAAK